MPLQRGQVCIRLILTHIFIHIPFILDEILRDKMDKPCQNIATRLLFKKSVEGNLMSEKQNDMYVTKTGMAVQPSHAFFKVPIENKLIKP